MSSEMDNSDLISDIVGGVPDVVKKSVTKTIKDLIGNLTAVSAAKLRQYTQGIDDIREARSIVSTEMAKSVAAQASKDAVWLKAAEEVYLPTAIRKARNRLAIVDKLTSHINEDSFINSSASPPEDDWMNAFTRFAEDASSEKLQDLFARILAGQLKRPGSISIRTIRSVGEIDQEIAAHFSMIWEKGVSAAVDYDRYFQRGDGFVIWKQLAEFGLMAPTDTVTYLPEYRPRSDGNSLWTPANAGGSWLTVYFPAGCSANWPHIDFTRVGREIGSILPRPDYERNMRQIGRALAQQGVSQVELTTIGKIPEILFKRI